MRIFKATEQDIPSIVEIFNLYRIFYEQESNLENCEIFITANLKQDRSEIFLLSDDNDQVVAFIQLYKAFCSINLQPYYYLSDLYVKAEAREHGYAHILMSYVIDFYSNGESQRITLDTAVSNIIAQKLYEKLGYKKDNEYVTYHKILSNTM